MLAGTQPSVELTGGPWFTDNELDTELVDTLKMVVNKHLQNSVRLLSLSLSLLIRYLPLLTPTLFE